MTCDICGTPIVRGDYFQSRFTKKRYCKDTMACNKRHLKRTIKEGRLNHSGKEPSVRS